MLTYIVGWTLKWRGGSLILIVLRVEEVHVGVADYYDTRKNI